MTRVKAIYRSLGIPCRGKQVYEERYRTEWLRKIQETGVRRRAALLIALRSGTSFPDSSVWPTIRESLIR
jgi:hypothetical protein